MSAPFLVTGGLGYAGRWIVRRLVDEGEAVVTYDRDFAEDDSGRVALVQGELFDLPRLVDTIRRHEVGAIVHTAAMSHPDLSVDLPLTTIAANVTGTAHVYEAARMASVRRIVNFSSECAYGHVAGPVREDAPLRPTTPYGVTKVTTEQLGEVYNRLFGLDVVSLRVSEVYGPGNRMPEVLRDLVRAAVDGVPFRLERGGDHRFHFVHVTDVARAALCAARAQALSQPAYNVNGGPQVSLREAAALVERLLPEAEISIGPGMLHLDRQGEWDTSAARRDLAYEPAITLAAGLADYVEWMRSNPF